jgi:hypothetical protein
MKFEEDIRIDEDALDIEWLNQPRLMLKYSKISAEAKMEMLLRKENLDLVKADLDKEIRSDPEKFGIVKITETAVSNTIISHKLYKEANTTYLQAQYEADIARGAVSAVEHKKDALENLVRLFGQNYFAGPQVPRDLSYEWQQTQKQKTTNESVSKVMRRKV